ncbi:aldehyde dehydrogenase (NAD+) [Halarchaeum solikamskense]|uniref:aldehyde dehydrogenase family protein n=1 Tax=Halarchaeum nitratireducens TaxID=489913 RepID=UPI001B3AD225|nr:aldehyde dehydrogenase family protein [Halarchaeum solikamskense]MBP2252407.1 aldehyde dehydrogenase (NAD+) [Halarchaeum solikamskense]
MVNNEEETDEYSVLFIGGETTPAADGATYDITDPVTEKRREAVAAADTEDVDRAVVHAREASETWTSLEAAERGRRLHAFADAIREEAAALARLEARDAGKPLSTAEADVGSLARYFEYYAGITDKIEGVALATDDAHFGYTRREPLGVTGHILPWNFPLLLFGRSVAPSLAAGNAVVVKPAEETPRTSIAVARIATDAGIPPGVINVVPGRGATAGSALANHAGIGCVSFTGSVPTGIEVGKAAVENVNPAHLELGGNGPNVIFPDADFENAVDNAVAAVFSNAGQVCSAGPRLIVHEDVHDAFVDAIVARAEAMSLGPVLDDPDMGPLVSEAHYEKVRGYIESAREVIGEPVTGGRALDRAGYFVEPTVFDDVPNDARIAREEVFGPVLTVTTFADEEEAIALANDTEYGLTAGIFTENHGRAHRFSRDVEAGVVYVNEWFAPGVEAPFGGYKKSGIGREAGLEAVRGYTQTKAVSGCIEK